MIHPGALGDVLLAIPAFRALRRVEPAPVVLAAAPRIAELARALGEVDDGVPLESLRLHRLFEDGEPASLDAHGPLARASRVVCWLGARDAAFVRRLTRLVPGAIVAASTGAGGSVWRHLLSTAGGEHHPVSLDPVSVSGALVDAGARLLAGAGWDARTPLVLVHPGAGGRAKRWPPPAFAALLDDLCRARPLQLAIHRGPADADAVAELRSRLGGPALLLDEPPLPVLAGALRHAAAFVGNDSGVSHLAAAVGAPAVILFTGPMEPWRPWAGGARAVEIITPAGTTAEDVARVGEAVRAALGSGPGAVLSRPAASSS